jgi:hypothetical protein
MDTVSAIKAKKIGFSVFFALLFWDSICPCLLSSITAIITATVTPRIAIEQNYSQKYVVFPDY